MQLEGSNFQIQDSISNKQMNVDAQATEVSSGLNIGRNTVEVSTIREFRIDSSRLIKPKRVVRPIIKTIPQVSVADTINHPLYNVVGNNFLLPYKTTFFDDLYFTPYNPSLVAKGRVKRDRTDIKSGEVKKIITEVFTTKDEFVVKSKLRTTDGFLSTDWMLGIIILSLIVFSWMRVGFSRYFQTAVQAAYNFFTARRITEEVNVTRNRVFYFMSLLFYINISLFLTQYLEYYHITIFKLQGILLFFTILTAILIVYSVKSILFSVLDFVFLGKNSFTNYKFTIFLYNKMIGIVLLPIVSLLPYTPDIITPWLFYLGAFVIVILYILRIFRGLQISFKNRLSIFYLILYLCALEIMPTLILFKVIHSYLQ